MPTINQLMRVGRGKIGLQKVNRGALQSNPQKRGVCTRAHTTTPKNQIPLYAKVAPKVRLTNGIEVICYIPTKDIIFARTLYRIS